MELTITFSVVSCACGAERQAGRSCPECGREPEEVDADLERRRAIVRRASARKPVEHVEPLSLENAFTATGVWFEGFSAAYEATGEGSIEDAVTRLRESLEDLDALHARATRCSRLRPDLALWEAIDGVLNAFNEVRDTYLDALTAATVDDAEKASAHGQAAIDGAAAELNRLNALHDAWTRVDSADLAHEHGDLLGGAEAVAALTGTTDMVALDREGAQLFNRITAGTAAAPIGFGLGLQLVDLMVQSSMDPARFWRTARTVYQLLIKHEVALRGLFADLDWRADLVDVSIETRDAGFEAAAVAAAGANRRRLVQSALRLAARQIERAAHPLIATLLAIEGRRPYASERRRDINSLLTRARQAGHEDLLLGLDPKLRDADAHREFEIDDVGVHLTGSRGDLDYLTDAELVDATLAGTETIVATYWGLVAALVAVGTPIEELEQVLALEIADADRVKLVLLLNGWRDVDVRMGDAHVITRGERDGENRVTLIASIASVVPESCETLTLIAIDDSGTHTASGPIAPLKHWSAGDEEEREIAFTLAGMAWTFDGVPLVSRAHTDKVFALRTLHALNPEVPPAAALIALRTLRDASQQIGNDELAQAIGAALRLRRQVASGKAPMGIEAVVAAFDRWLVSDLPEIRSSW